MATTDPQSPDYTVSTAINWSPDLPAALEAFLDDLGQWIDDCIGRYEHETPTKVHDQATYTTGWAPYLIARPDDRHKAFLLNLADKIRDRHIEADAWRHGYWRMQEAHHGTEHYELFLGTLLRLWPDCEAGQQLLDASEHLGNWSDDVPAWFDWDTGCYLSTHFGTDGIESKPGSQLNIADHLRCVNMALRAYEISPESGYLHLIEAHLGAWADAINQGETLPMGMVDGKPIYAFDKEMEDAYYSFAGMAPMMDNDVARAENLLCSDAPKTLLWAWERLGDKRYRQACKRLLDVLATQLDDPEAGAVSDVIRHYRRATGDTRYDQAILAAAAKLQPLNIERLTLAPNRKQGGGTGRSHRAAGIGKRGDAPAWYENDEPRRHSPILLACAAELKQDANLAAAATDLARAYFKLGRQVYPDGRDHGCSSRSVSAIARGHGRDNHAGMTTAVLAPLQEAFV